MSINPRAAALGAVLLSLLIAAPAFLDRYLLSVLIVSLYFAYVGQAWNLLMGYAGLLSLGHALYVGLGAYAAAYLYVAHGVTPLIGLFAGVIAASPMGMLIGALGFRFRIEGVYFALLTIAFAEFVRIGFDHGRRHALLGQQIGSREPCRPCADDQHIRMRHEFPPNPKRGYSRGPRRRTPDQRSGDYAGTVNIR